MENIFDSEMQTNTDLDEKPKDFKELYNNVDDEIAQI